MHTYVTKYPDKETKFSETGEPTWMAPLETAIQHVTAILTSNTIACLVLSFIVNGSRQYDCFCLQASFTYYI